MVPTDVAAPDVTAAISRSVALSTWPVPKTEVTVPVVDRVSEGVPTRLRGGVTVADVVPTASGPSATDPVMVVLLPVVDEGIVDDD